MLDHAINSTTLLLIINRSHNEKCIVLIVATYSLSSTVIHDCVSLLF